MKARKGGTKGRFAQTHALNIRYAASATEPGAGQATESPTKKAKAESQSLDAKGQYMCRSLQKDEI